MLPDLHTGFSRGRSGGLVYQSPSEFSSLLWSTQSKALVIEYIYIIVYNVLPYFFFKSSHKLTFTNIEFEGLFFCNTTGTIIILLIIVFLIWWLQIVILLEFEFTFLRVLPLRIFLMFIGHLYFFFYELLVPKFYSLVDYILCTLRLNFKNYLHI